ncbi:reverse transcriptase [Tanacetum coccineum]
MVIITRSTSTQEPSNQTPPPEPQNLTELCQLLRQISDKVDRLCLFKDFAIAEFAKINAGEGTSGQGGNNGNLVTTVPNNNTQHHHNTYGKLTRLDFPKFNGEDVKGWLFRVQQFFVIDQSNQDKFEMLLNKVDLSESQAVCMFMGGLKSEVGMPLRLFKPATMKDVSCLAKMQEATVALTKPKPQYSYNISKVLNLGKYMPIEVMEDEEFVDCSQNMEERPQISLNALSGVNAYKTMRIRGYLGKQLLHILMDSGSTHNFLAMAAARRMGCQLRKTVPLEVSVANGNQMVSEYLCKDFEWTIQGITYKTDVMVIPLSSCKRVVLRGSQQAVLTWLNGKKFPKKVIQDKAELSLMSVCVYPGQLWQVESNAVGSVDAAIQEVLDEYKSMFEVPKELPPKRVHDHAISLMPNTPPINKRPYRHPPNQKEVVELMVKELMDSGVIRDSTSSFSSPIVLVKKKDGSWRMCVDYRKLNKYTVKDNFPIPVIEELLDELNGAKVFSKLDLRPGYHQNSNEG